MPPPPPSTPTSPPRPAQLLPLILQFGQSRCCRPPVATIVPVVLCHWVPLLCRNTEPPRASGLPDYRYANRCRLVSRPWSPPSSLPPSPPLFTAQKFQTNQPTIATANRPRRCAAADEDVPIHRQVLLVKKHQEEDSKAEAVGSFSRFSVDRK